MSLLALLVCRQLAFVAGTREIRFEMSGKRALAWQLFRPLEGEAQLEQLATELHARLRAVDQLQTSRIDRLYGVLAAAAKLPEQSAQEEVGGGSGLRGGCR
jgi:hypothetical protein